MTIEVDPTGPGTAIYKSTLWACSVNAQSAYVYKAARTVLNYSPLWSGPGAYVTLHWVTFGANETTTVKLVRQSGTISTVDIYPHIKQFAATWTSNTITLTLPPDSHAYVVVNGDWDNVVMVFADPLKEALPALPVDVFVSKPTNSTALANRVTYFGPGVWTIEELWPVQSGAKIYLDYGAWVKGSFDLTGCVDVKIMGPGVLSGERVAAETVQALAPNFLQQLTYSAIYGGIPAAPSYENHVRNVTCVLYPFYGATPVVNHWSRAKMLSPWVYNCDGIKAAQSITLGYATVQKCFVYCGDDGLDLAGNPSLLAEDNTLLQVNGAAIHLGYFGYPQSGGQTIVARTCVTSIGNTWPQPTYPADSNAIIKLWVDDTFANSALGRSNVYVDQVWAEGPGTSNVSLFSIRNYAYPYTPPPSPKDGAGSIYNLQFKRMYFEEPQFRKSQLIGLNADNTPHDIDFSQIVINGTELSVQNWLDYVDQNEFPYRISVGGHPLATAVDICNLALSYIGDSAKITAISPPDGSAQAAACARFYTIAVNSVLEMAHWSFATKYATLTQAATNERTEWDFCYVLPADTLKAISILPKDADDDYGTRFIPHDSIYYVPVVAAGSYNPRPFAIEQTASGSVVLYTDQEDARLRYQAYVTNTNLFPPLFIMAVTWNLASLLSGPLIGGDQGAEQAKRCIQMMQMYLAKASVSDADQRQIKPDHVVSWMSNR